MTQNSDLIELQILGLSHYKKVNKFQALFTDEKTMYRVILARKNNLKSGLTVIIGESEAQSIAIALEKMTPAIPLTFDIFKNTLDLFEIKLSSVYIDELDTESIFHAKLTYNLNEKTKIVDVRTVDALSLAVRVGCPIYIKKEVFDKVEVNVSS